MIGGLGDLFSAVVNMSLALDVSAISGDQLKLKAIARASVVSCWRESRPFQCVVLVACAGM